MKEKDKISDIYRKKVDVLLDNQSEHPLFKSLNQEELDDIWKEISTELDIGEVWNEISSDLDIVMPVDTNSGIFAKSIAAIIIIIIGMVPVKKALLDSRIDQPAVLIETRQNEQPGEVITNNNGVPSNVEQVKGDIYLSQALIRSLNKSKESNKPDSTERNISELTQEAEKPISDKVAFHGLSAPETTDSNFNISASHILTEKSNILTAVTPEDELKRIKVYIKTNFDNLKIRNISSVNLNSFPSTKRGIISAGLITLYKNTWLLNHETYDGLKSESLNSSEIVFYPDVGISLNYSFNKNWLIQADGFLFSNTGQEYVEYLYGHYARKKITLRYSTIALSLKHKFTSSEHLIPRSSINIFAGGYFSVLQYASQKINANLENIGSQYERFDFGVRLASEFELQIFNQLSLAPGVSLSIGIPNIYKGNIRVPAKLIRTHNGSADLQLTLYYHFR